jgi:phasin family protein
MAKAKTVKSGADPIESALETGTEAVRDSFEKAAKGYEQMFAFGKENAEAVMKAATLAGKGWEAIGTEVFAFSRQSVEESVAMTKAMMGSKSVQELLALQSEYAKSAFETYVAELTRVRDLAMTTAKVASAPLQQRVSAFSDLVQTGRAA